MNEEAALVKKVVIVHGWTGSPEKDWMPWLANELRMRGYRVFVPKMPFSNVPMPFLWIQYLRKVVGTLDENTYFVGHSVGCQAIMRMLAEQKCKVGGAVFVAGWFVAKDFMKNARRPSFYKAFYRYFGSTFKWFIVRWEKPFDYETLGNAIPRSVAIFSTNDKFVDCELNAKLFKDHVGSEILTVENAGHFTKEDGFEKFPWLLETILKIITGDEKSCRDE